MKFKEEGPEFTVLSIVEYSGFGRAPKNGALHLRLMKDGSLRIRTWTSSDDLVWRKETGEARASADSGTNQAVAYLDGLKNVHAGRGFTFPTRGWATPATPSWAEWATVAR